MPTFVCTCLQAHLPQVRSLIFKGRDICILSGPRLLVAERALVHPPQMKPFMLPPPCLVLGPWSTQLRECRVYHLHFLMAAAAGPRGVEHVWLQGV